MSLQSRPTLCDLMDCSLPGSSIHGIFQAWILEWVAMSSSRRSSQPRDRTQISYVSCIGRQVLYHYCHLGSPRSTMFQLKNKTKQKQPWYHLCTKAAFILNCPTERCFSGKSVANLDVDANNLQYQTCVTLKKCFHWLISSSVGFQQ